MMEELSDQMIDPQESQIASSADKPEILSRLSLSPLNPRATSPASPWRIAWRKLRSNRLAVAGAVILAIIAVLAIVVPLLVTIDPFEQDLSASLLPPGSPGYPLGTDHLGRNILLRLIDGARLSLTVGLISVSISVTFGCAIGLISGYYGGWSDAILMRLIDMQLAFPGILAALVIVTILGNGIDKAMIAVGLGSIPRYARLVRGTVLSVKNHPFVDAARSVGASDIRIMLVHIIPNVLGPVITLSTLGMATAVLSTAALSFLGLGAQPPTAEWGLMVSEGRRYLRIAWWPAALPGLAIMIMVGAINLIGDGIRDAFDPYRTVGRA